MSVVVAWQRALRRRPPGVERWVYCGEDAAWRFEARRGVLADVEEISTGAVRERWARELRRPYLEWIAGLGARNDSFEWWSSPLAAKNVYAHLFSRMVALAATIEALEDDVLVVCSTPALVAEVRDAAAEQGLTVRGRRSRNLRRPAYMAAWRMRQALGGERLPRMDPGGASSLLATWVDDRSIDSDGRYSDPHFGPLPQLLAGRGERPAFLARPLPGANGRELAPRLIRTSETFLFPGAYLTAADRRAARAGGFGFEPDIPTPAQVGPLPVSRLASELIAQERINHVEALSYRAVVRNLAAAGARFDRVVLPWEGHAWETALTAAVHEHMPGCSVVGYDNVNFSSLALSLYPGSAELGIRPLPDRIVANGRTFAGILAGEGFPGDRIRVGCALRHGYIHEIEQRARAEGFVLVAGSIDAAQTIELVETAYEAFGDEAIVKLHPAVDAARVRRAVSAPVSYSDRPIGELLGEARAMLYTYSVVAYEALAAGVPPIFVRSETFLDLDQLEPNPDVRLVARTPEELRAADRTAGGLGDEWRARAREVVSAALEPPRDSCVEAFL